MNVEATALSAELRQSLARCVDARFEAVKAAYVESLRVPSVKADPAPGAPYGEPVARALEHARAAAEALGLATFGFDGRTVAADAGTAEPYVATIGHLDVVPPGAGWTRDPFAAEVRDDLVYARGAVDDKSGAFASLLAVAAVNDLLADGALDLPRRVRVIFGGDEECGMTCVRHYMATQPAPVFAVAPDGAWPLVFAEKGMAALELAGALPAGGGLVVERLTAGTRRNVVPGVAEARLAGAAPRLDAAAAVLEGYWDRNVTWRRSADGIDLTAIGEGGHASRPLQADNAVARMLRVFHSLPLTASTYWLNVLNLTDSGGGGLGLADCDSVSGATSANLGVVAAGNGRIRLGFDVRYPVRRDLEWVKQRAAASARHVGLELVSAEGIDPLHEPIDSPLVQTVMAVYNAETDEGLPPYSRGGRTYAAYVPHCVCVGRSLPGEPEGGVHGPDEHYSFASLRGGGRMLAHLLIRLARTPAPDD